MSNAVLSDLAKPDAQALHASAGIERAVLSLRALDPVSVACMKEAIDRAVPAHATDPTGYLFVLIVIGRSAAYVASQALFPKIEVALDSAAHLVAHELCPHQVVDVVTLRCDQCQRACLLLFG